jgi:hypothetical protein
MQVLRGLTLLVDVAEDAVYLVYGQAGRGRDVLKRDAVVLAE